MARELILKLGKKITDRVDVKLGMTKLDEDSPEYYGLASVVTDEMAELALAMKVRVPTTPAEIGKKVGKDPVYVEQLFDQMSMIGLLEYNWENADHHKQWTLPIFVPGSAELMNMNLQQVETHPEIAQFFERMAYLPLAGITEMVPPGGAGIGMHVIPVEKAIETENESVDLEHISYWLSKPAEHPAYEGAVELVSDISGQYAFRQIEGTLPDGRRALVIWRSVTDDIVASNAALDAYFTTSRNNAEDRKYDVIFVNGDSNLENLRGKSEGWTVRMTETEFKNRMFEEA